jgi:hypothetical protein
MSMSTASCEPEVPFSALGMALITAAQHPRDPLPLVIPKSVIPADVIRYKLGLIVSDLGLPASILDNKTFRTFILCCRSSTEH